MTLTADFVTGTNVPYQRLRWAMHRLGQTQEGVLESGDFKVAQRATGGANMSVDIAAGDAWVDIDSGVRNGRAHIVNDATAPPENRAVAASHATLPRIDLAVLDYNDTSIPAGQGGNTPTLRVLTGTPTASVTLDAPGASPPAVPGDALLLAMILVPAASTSVITGNIRDRRKWARGVYNLQTKTNADAATSSATPASIDSALLSCRVELSGRPVDIRFDASWLSAGAQGGINMAIVRPDGVTENPSQRFYQLPASGTAGALRWAFPYVPPAPGSHLITPLFSSGSGGTTITLEGSAARPMVFEVEERLRQIAAN